MRQLTRPIATLLIGCLFLLSQTGCKENTLVNANVAPGINTVGINATDTFTIISTSVLDTDVVTSNSISGYPVTQGLGIINSDPFFGKTTASIYAQFIPQITSPTFFNTDIIDSVVLILPYTGYSYGDTSVDPVIGVFPIIDTGVSYSKSYFATSNVVIDRNALYGSDTMHIASLSDSLYEFGANRTPALHIALNAACINALKDATISSGSDVATFLKAFRGLCIAPLDTNQMGKSISYFQLDGTDTFSMANILVYHHASGGSEQIFQYYFDQTNCMHYNHITRDYTGTIANNYFHNSGTNDSIVMLQNQPGASIDLRFPFLKNSLPNCVINKAELIITQLNDYSNSSLLPPINIFPETFTIEDDSITNVQDLTPVTSLSPRPFLDGNSHTVNIDGQNVTQYVINIPREVEKCIREQRDLHLRIIGTQDYYGAYRLVAGGGNYSNKNFRVRLNIVYSKPNK